MAACKTLRLPCVKGVVTGDVAQPASWLRKTPETRRRCCSALKKPPTMLSVATK